MSDAADSYILEHLLQRQHNGDLGCVTPLENSTSKGDNDTLSMRKFTLEHLDHLEGHRLRDYYDSAMQTQVWEPLK